MIVLFIFSLLSGIVRSQQPTDSYGPSKDLLTAMEDAIEGTAMLRSLVDSIQEMDVIPNLQGLTVLVEQLSPAARSIGKLFSLTQKLITDNKIIDVNTIDKKYKQLGVGFDHLKFTEEGIHVEDRQRPVFNAYKVPHNKLNEMYEAYVPFINNITINTNKESFVTACNSGKTEPGGVLNSIHSILHARDTNHSSNFVEVLQIATYYDFNLLKRIIQVIVKDVVRATLMRQACMGVKQKDIIELATAADQAQEKIREIVTRLRWIVHKFATDPFKERASTLIGSMFQRWSNLPLANITTELKKLLVEEYSWLLWNVFAYEMSGNSQRHENSRLRENTLGEFVGAIRQTDRLENLMFFFNGNKAVAVIWGEVKEYDDEKNGLYNYYIQMQHKLYTNGCGSGNDPSFVKHRDNYKELREHIPFMFAGESRGKFFTDIADNAVEFKICDLYIAAVLV